MLIPVPSPSSACDGPAATLISTQLLRSLSYRKRARGPCYVINAAGGRRLLTANLAHLLLPLFIHGDKHLRGDLLPSNQHICSIMNGNSHYINCLWEEMCYCVSHCPSNKACMYFSFYRANTPVLSRPSISCLPYLKTSLCEVTCVYLCLSSPPSSLPFLLSALSSVTVR